MHRSGTSCLTGSLQAAGVFLGDCHTWNPYNQKGNRENQRIVDLNDAVLAANGGGWDKPPEQVVWPGHLLAAARALLGEYAGSGNFGFKDPRTLLVVDGWKVVCPHLQFVGIFRHPDLVADSLARRSEMPRESALALWYQYNQRLYRQYLQQPFPLLCFDDDPVVFQRKLSAVIQKAGIGCPQAAGGFYDADLKSALAPSGQGLPWRIRRLHRKLQRLAE
jgi:hypothetical protein